MQLADLQLAALIFSVPIHQYEVHPHLSVLLKQLEAEGEIALSRQQEQVARTAQAEVKVRLQAGRDLN